MSEIEARKLEDCLLKQNSVQVRSWLEKVLQGEETVPEQFNWLCFAEVTALFARKDLDLEWAEVATRVYDLLASKEINSSYRNSLMQSSMTLRVYMILKLGAVPKNPILDVNNIINWFFDELNISYEEALNKVYLWQEWKTQQQNSSSKIQLPLSIEEIRDLSRIKQKLSTIKLLSSSSKFKQNEQLDVWLSIRKDLP